MTNDDDSRFTVKFFNSVVFQNQISSFNLKFQLIKSVSIPQGWFYLSLYLDFHVFGDKSFSGFQLFFLNKKGRKNFNDHDLGKNTILFKKLFKISRNSF